MANGDINVRIAAAGDMTQGRNEINPRFQANALRNARGLDCGVLANDFYNESADYLGITRGANSGGEPFAVANNYSASQITIGAGMATAYGYDLQIEQNIALTTDENGSALTAATGYLFVYLEWDLTGSPAVGDIKIHNNGTAGVWRSIYTDNDNLIENPQGKYKLPLHRFYKASTGSIRYDGSWETLNLARTIERPQVAEVALYAETMDEGDDSDRVATTKYVDRAVDSAASEVQSTLNAAITSLTNTINNTVLNFSTATLTVAGVATLTLRRLDAWVVGDLEWETGASLTGNGLVMNPFTSGDVVCTIPSGFRPRNTTYCVLMAYMTELTAQVSSVYFDAYRCEIDPTTGEMTVLSRDRRGSQYLYCWKFHLNFGYIASGYTGVYYTDETSLTAYPITSTATGVYLSVPSTFKKGATFKGRAIALEGGKEAVLTIADGYSTQTAYGNGEFSVTPNSNATAVTITATARNIDGLTEA